MTYYCSAFVTALVLLDAQTAQVAPFRSSIDPVKAYVSAVPGDGRPIRDLTSDDFELRRDGELSESYLLSFVR